jgi:hypothetical protein
MQQAPGDQDKQNPVAPRAGIAHMQIMPRALCLPHIQRMNIQVVTKLMTCGSTSFLSKCGNGVWQQASLDEHQQNPYGTTGRRYRNTDDTARSLAAPTDRGSLYGQCTFAQAGG